jgi:DNA-binding transcriptional LysR family regulator
VNPHHLELFYHVAKSGGVSRAARQMSYGIQQPSVSTQVNALERDLGVALYERRPFKLTPAGQQLFEFVRPFFGRIAEVRERIQGGAQIRLGASPILFRDHLPAVIEQVRKRFAKLTLVLRAMNQPELIEAIEHNELDLVISLIPENLGPAIRTIALIELPLVLLVPKSLKITEPKELWQGGNVSYPLISLGPRELIAQLFQQKLTKSGVTWNPRVEMDSLELIEKYVEAGYGIGLSVRVPGQNVSKKIRMLDLPDFPSVRLGILYRDDPNPNDQVRNALLEAIQREAARFG